MWTTFTKALNAASSSVQVSIVNGAVNFSASVSFCLCADLQHPQRNILNQFSIGYIRLFGI